MDDKATVDSFLSSSANRLLCNLRTAEWTVEKYTSQRITVCIECCMSLGNYMFGIWVLLFCLYRQLLSNFLQ